MGLEYLVNSAEIAWKQGVDLYTAYDNRLARGFEYTAKYNLGHDVPFEYYESYQGKYKHTNISKKGRGRLRPMYDKIVQVPRLTAFLPAGAGDISTNESSIS